MATDTKIVYKKSIYNKIKKSLHAQIKDSQPHFADLIEDYMKLWILKEELNHDIKQRGVNIQWSNGTHQMGWKKNDSVTEIVKVSSHMIKILDTLGIKCFYSDAKDADYEDYM